MECKPLEDIGVQNSRNLSSLKESFEIFSHF